MELFRRRFATEILSAPTSVPPIVIELFRRWVLPGQSGDGGLRVAVRDGYLNLYVGGQSVAKIEASARNGVRVSLHQKYVHGIRKPPNRQNANQAESENLSERDMITLRGDALRPPNAEASVDRWIETAATYSGDEKLFVETLVGANPNVIDLEMALPGDDRLLNEKKKKVAPRMDLVTVVQDTDGKARLNFWEAKCAVNGELRAEAEIDIPTKSGAHVAQQLHKYVEWMGLAGREDEVAAAFRETGSVLLKLAEIFGKDLNSPACQSWRLLEAGIPSVERRPGIVIANYDPRPGQAGSGDRNHERAKSFARHKQRLEEIATTVVEVAAATAPAIILSPLPNQGRERPNLA